MCEGLPTLSGETILLTLLVAIIVLRLLWVWRTHRNDLNAFKLAEYNKQMRDRGYTRSFIGNVAVWIPPCPKPQTKPSAGFKSR